MKIFCIGIGGIGISALARYYAHAGHTVIGSDAADSPLIHTLIREGISVSIGQDASHITSDIDMVVYTIAVSDSNPELARAKELGLTCKTYPEALGEVTKQKKTIAICGTHGKTTTTAMTYYALKACGINPTVIVGSLLSGVGTNFVPGDSEYMVVEACEYRRSFLNLHPTHVIVTNIDADHLDYYKDLTDIQDAFQTFADKISEEGFLVTHNDVSLTTGGTLINADSIDKSTIALQVLGDHNKRNAQLVLALTDALGLPEEKVREGLRDFPGTWRRLEYKGATGCGVPVYDDYGHHPTELRATIDALYGKYPQGEHTLHVFFQPHLYSRTKLFLKEFAEVLAIADQVYIMPIYASREVDNQTISGEVLVDEINKAGGRARLLANTSEMSSCIEAIDDSQAVVLNIGAGNAYEELSQLKLS